MENGTSEEGFGSAAESLSTRSAGKREDGERNDLHSSFPADRFERSADSYDPTPSREDTSARRSLLPPISDDVGQDSQQTQQEILNDPFVSSRSEQSEHRTPTGSPREGDSSRIQRNIRAEHRGEGVREEKKIAAETDRSRRIKSERSGTEQPTNLLVPKAEQGMTFDKGEQGRERIGPRRLVAGRNESDSRDEGIHGRDFEEIPFGKANERSLAEPDRARSWDDLQEVSFDKEGPKGGRPERSGKGRLLVPNHAGGNERVESAEGRTLPSPSAELRGTEETSSRTINVTIGRIEVRGVPERKAPPTPVRKPAKKGSESVPTMSLSDYLKRYNGSGG